MEKLKTVYEWMPEFFDAGKGNAGFELHFDSLKVCEVESLNAAKRLINARVRSTRAWLDGFLQTTFAKDE